jgi:hypothetical protein
MIWLMAAVGLLSVVLSPPQVDSIDALQRLRVARAMWQHGDVAIGYHPDPYHETHLAGHDGRGYALYGIGQSVLLVPLDVVAYSVASLLPASEQGRELVRDAGVGLMYRVILGPLLALACALVLRRLGLSRRSAVLWALLALLTTPMLHWSYSMQEEGLAGLMLLLGLWIALSPGRQARAGVLLGLCFGALLNVRYNAMLPAACVGLIALLRMPAGRLRLVVATGATMVPFAMLSLLYNWVRFRDVLQTGYQDRIEESTHVWSWSLGEFGNLLAGPHYGALWFSIPVLAGLLVLRRRRLSVAGALVFAALLGALVFLAGFMIRGVGGLGGPRYLGHVLLLAAPFGMLALRALVSRGGLRLGIAAGVLAVGALVQLSGTVFPWHLETIQRQVRQHADLPPPEPQNVVLARFANIGRLAGGSLFEYSLPAEVDRAGLPPPISEDAFRVATTPNYLPWRARGGLRATQAAPSGLVAAATAVWVAALLGCAASGAMLARSLCRRRHG